MSDSTETAENTLATGREALHRVAANLRWSWHRPSAELLASVPGADADAHPLANIANADGLDLDRWLDENQADIVRISGEIEELQRRNGDPAIAYFCPEFGIAAQVPQYSGGLGILAGDHLKAASDTGLPLVGIGLLYRSGFFHQDIVDGEQTERFEAVDPHLIGARETGVSVTVAVDSEDVEAVVWEMWVGATRLILLDTDVDSNSDGARKITDRLYAGDRRHRLSQELILGVGGVRALRALDLTPDVYHLNEGHACFLLLELLAELIEGGATLDEATEAVRGSTLFTTHTPVPAGIDRFDQDLIAPDVEAWAARLGVSPATVQGWATLPSDGEDPPFNTAALAFSFCGRVNGVSQLHAIVSRKLFRTLPSADRVEGITNGIHARTWVAPAIQDLYDDVLGAGWENGDESAWARVDDITADRFTKIMAIERSALVDKIYGITGTQLDPDRCLIGFARRFATYKRAALLLRDPEGLQASLAAGAQFVFAGKAHPADDEGKAVLAEIARFSKSAEADGSIVIIPDYDIEIAKAMYSGCDVWLNNPIRPHEACGTSGEKAALNGVLNFSISDGWWADWYTDGIGWVIPTSDLDERDARDDEEAAALHSILTNDVLRRFRGDNDAWFAMTATMLKHLGPLVTAGRMVNEYESRFYRPIRS